MSTFQSTNPFNIKDILILIFILICFIAMCSCQTEHKATRDKEAQQEFKASQRQLKAQFGKD